MIDETYNEDDREETPATPEADDDQPDTGDQPYDPEGEDTPVNKPGDTTVIVHDPNPEEGEDKEEEEDEEEAEESEVDEEEEEDEE